ncbi:MAG: hypothetical protein SVO01_00650 [Thermotogota bacterium]|nr:hypothetical protein [Thermotogota bacterium]
MKCKFCACETLMTVRDNSDNVFPCCPCCKDIQNMNDQKLIVHMVILDQIEIPEKIKHLPKENSFSFNGGYDVL